MLKLPENLESKYRFVTLASMRAEQLQAGAVARVDSIHHKATIVAQEEVAAGVVEPWDPETAAPGTEGEEAGAEGGEE